MDIGELFRRYMLGQKPAPMMDYYPGGKLYRWMENPPIRELQPNPDVLIQKQFNAPMLGQDFSREIIDQRMSTDPLAPQTWTSEEQPLGPIDKEGLIELIRKYASGRRYKM